MQAFVQGGKARAEEILGPPPRTGHVSVYAKKLTALAFVALCAVVVWGHSANIGAAKRTCPSSCVFQIAFAVLIWLYVSMLLLFNYLCEKGTMLRTGFFSHGLEVQLVGVAVLLWVPLVATVSAIGKAPPLTTWFAWLGFFGNIYATFLAYHSFKEEDLPTNIPVGFDEEDYVYG